MWRQIFCSLSALAGTEYSWDRACVGEDALMGFRGLSTLHPLCLLKRREADMTRAGFFIDTLLWKLGQTSAPSVMKDLSIIHCSVKTQ